MPAKIIRCYCGQTFDPEVQTKCPACSRPAPKQGATAGPELEAESGSHGSAGKRTVPPWLLKAGAVFGAFLLVLLLGKALFGSSGSKRQASTTASLIKGDQTTPKGGDCSAIAGDWRWFTGGYVHFSSDGTANYSNLPGGGAVSSATWNCDADSGNYVIRWSSGYTDRLHLTNQGQVLQGTDNLGVAVTGNRVQK